MALVFILSLTFLTTLHGRNPTAAGGKTTHLSQSQMQQLVTEYIDGRLANKVEKYAVEFIQLPPALTLPSNATVEIETGNPPALRGNVNFLLRVETGENAQRRLAIVVLIRTYETVLVATTMIDRHLEIVAAMVRSETAETTNLPATPIRALDELKERRTKGIVPAGRILHSGLFESVPVVHRGAPVTIVVRIGGVTTKTLGKALEDAGLDEVIRVQNSSSKKVLSCIVENKNTVRAR